nr:MAG TPA: hypothetical protein [Caudoviricetes sp.]
MVVESNIGYRKFAVTRFTILVYKLFGYYRLG